MCTARRSVSASASVTCARNSVWDRSTGASAGAGALGAFSAASRAAFALAARTSSRPSANSCLFTPSFCACRSSSTEFRARYCSSDSGEAGKRHTRARPPFLRRQREKLVSFVWFSDTQTLLGKARECFVAGASPSSAPSSPPPSSSSRRG